ncbi:MAG: MFS transporter [Betaproteobacteria bacterium RIFCSPLOWO2_12_FULL_65_14]|nr:MAG: MFS transporter [Betaproteobacteria bacterium RIFCSPLOWO2_12_FULL_65_14]
MRRAAESKRSFRHFSLAGIFFQGGVAAVDSNTVVPALVHGLTGSAVAVGAAVGTVRFGWLFPQLFVAYCAQRRAQRLPFYMLGAFGRVACLAGVAALLGVAGSEPGLLVVIAFFVLWTVYSFVSGIVAVPYNDIVARSIPSAERSRMLALRFFGGGLLALAVAGTAHRILQALSFPGGYGALLALGAALLLISALFFVTAGEPAAPAEPSPAAGFRKFLRRGIDILVQDRRFRLFLAAQWLGGTAAMALPFYILQTQRSALEVAFLLGAQTAGALLSNPLWGWWGDRRGKRELLQTTAAAGIAAPLLALAWIAADGRWAAAALPYFALVFALLGAVGNGSTIAYLGYLMEISPDDRRPAYSGYFNALAAPAALFPLAGGAVAQAGSFAAVFALSAAAAVLQFLTVWRLRNDESVAKAA